MKNTYLLLLVSGFVLDCDLEFARFCKEKLKKILKKNELGDFDILLVEGGES